MAQLEALRRALSKTARILTRDAEGYHSATEQFASTAYDAAWAEQHLAPDAIVYCTCEAPRFVPPPAP